MDCETSTASKKVLPSFTTAGNPSLWVAAVILVFGLGVALRVYPSAAFTGVGFDEALYKVYVTSVNKVGLVHYPEIVEHYIAKQEKEPMAMLPPTRFLYIYCSHLWSAATGDAPLIALHRTACLFSILMLGVVFGFALRLTDRWGALALLALVACAPTQLHMSQHALIDGFFTCWATLVLWMFWENLKCPDDPLRTAALIVSLALMVMTKENAFFVFVGLGGIVATNPWLQFGKVTPRLLLALCLGPLLGVCGLVMLSGGLTELITTYKLLVSKSQNLEYAIRTGDGPWYRYLVDLLLASPLVLLLAVGNVFQLRKENKPALFLLTFIVGSYLVMCNVRYGMNLRYTNMWDMPLRLFAFSQLALLSTHFGRRGPFLLTLAVAGLCTFDLHQYSIFFVQNPLYELVSEGLLRALLILK